MDLAVNLDFVEALNTKLHESSIIESSCVIDHPCDMALENEVH